MGYMRTHFKRKRKHEPDGYKINGRPAERQNKHFCAMGLQKEKKNRIKFLSKITTRNWCSVHGYDLVSRMSLRCKLKNVPCWTVSINGVPEKLPATGEALSPLCKIRRVKYLCVNKVILKLLYCPNPQNTDSHIVHLLQITLLILVSTLSHKQHVSKKKLLNTKCVLIFRTTRGDKKINGI
jgi:hypothetical protein